MTRLVSFAPLQNRQQKEPETTMHTMTRTLMTVALLGAAARAHAQSADSGWYVGVGAGVSNFSDNIPKQIANAYAGNNLYTFTDARTTDDSDTAAQIFVGYKFNSWIALEIGYQDLGEANTHYDLAPINSPQGKPPSVNGRYRANDVNAVVVGTLPINEQFELLARAGVSDVRLKYDERGVDVNGQPFSRSYGNDDSTHPMFGVGALWRFSPRLAVRVDLDRNFNVGRKFALTAQTNGRFDNIDAYTVNLIWNP
jgi:OOP family OmpA-OmpF porin